MILTLEKIKLMENIAKQTLVEQDNSKWALFLTGICDFLDQYEDIEDYGYLPKHDFEMEFNKNIDKFCNLPEVQENLEEAIRNYGFSIAEEVCAKTDLYSKMRPKCSIHDIAEEIEFNDEFGAFLDGIKAGMEKKFDTFRDWALPKLIFDKIWEISEILLDHKEETNKDNFLIHSEMFKIAEDVSYYYAEDEASFRKIDINNKEELFNIFEKKQKENIDPNKLFDLGEDENNNCPEIPKTDFINDLLSLFIDELILNHKPEDIIIECKKELQKNKINDFINERILIAIRKNIVWNNLNNIDSKDIKREKDSNLTGLYNYFIKEVENEKKR